MSFHSRQGSVWHQWDLHFHTPSSYDYEDKSVTNKQMVDALLSEDIRVVAVTDHHHIDIQRIRELQDLGGDKLTVLPGIEFRSDQGGTPIHYISIFPEDCNLEHVWTTLQGFLGLTVAAITEKGGDQNVYVPIEKGAAKTRELGGAVSIHAGAKSNSIESISNKEQFQQRIKYDITNEWVDLMEIGQIKDIDAHLNTIFPKTGLKRPLIICSDNHNIADYTRRARLWLRADPTFRGLLMVLQEPSERVFMGERPPEHVRVEQNPTKYVRLISFQRKPSAPDSQVWFSGDIPFNSGLVAIIGNKGSGKSALSDTLGLLGATKNADSFSFLSKQRFRHPSRGYAQHFEASLHWESGETVARCLADSALPEELERLKYLPQDHVETVCNELAGIDEAGFEQELKAVIFSHVPKASCLDQTTLDDLVRFQTNEKQKRIDSLLKQLRDISRARTALEEQADPRSQRELEEKVERRQLEIDAHNSAKPAAKPNPNEDAKGPPPDPSLLKELDGAEKTKAETESKIAATVQKQRKEERRHAVATRLIEKLDNFQKEYDVFTASLKEDAAELGLNAADLVSVTIETADTEKIRDEAAEAVTNAKALVGETDSEGLRAKLAKSQKVIADLQTKLDAPNRAYQLYLKQLADWGKKLKELEGDTSDPDSLKGLNASLASLAELPARISDLGSQQIVLSLDIHSEKLAQAAVYRTLYEHVQKFIDGHVLAKDKLKLEFRAELVDQGFTPAILELLDLNRRGSFRGTDEGKAKAETFTQATLWEDRLRKKLSVNWFILHKRFSRSRQCSYSDIVSR